jgi:hypothetical protein
MMTPETVQPCLSKIAAGGTDYATGALDLLTLVVDDGDFTTVQVGANNGSSVPADSAAVTENPITFNVGRTPPLRD